MYLPKAFCENDQAVIKGLIDAYPLALMVGMQDGVLQADHLPFFLDEQNGNYRLITHIAKANSAFGYLDGQEVLVVFTGAQGYISPNWYPSKHIHHRQVPTYNYQVVHVRGMARVLTDEKSLMYAVGQLTKRQEQSQSKPWKLKDAPSEYIKELLTHIAVVQIEITDIQAKSKLSQNKDKADFDGVIDGLTQSGELALAQTMMDANKAVSD